MLLWVRYLVLLKTLLDSRSSGFVSAFCFFFFFVFVLFVTLTFVHLVRSKHAIGLSLRNVASCLLTNINMSININQDSSHNRKKYVVILTAQI